MSAAAIKNIFPMGFMWETADPFLFCVHHADAYPRGNAEMGPDASLEGRNIGQDFQVKDGWRMYHGSRVPGFPEHPHRGFETVTVVRRGFVDHADSHGAAGRYGNGDVQWMTAGSGLQHAEMFPLIETEKENPLELFQIWLNLPKAKKFSAPHFRMLWSESIPVHETKDASGKKTDVTIIAGRLRDDRAPDPAPDSWAADEANDVAIWIIEMEAGAQWTLPAASEGLNRRLYVYEGDDVVLAGSGIAHYHAAEVDAGIALSLESGASACRILLLQGRPIREVVMQYGPFVMNTKSEIQEAFEDYQQTRFGGWPWDRPDPVHPRGTGRFARFADGREETP